MRGLLRWLAVAAACGLTLPGSAQDRETGGDPKGAKEGEKPGKLEPPRMTYRHTTARGNEGEFTLNGAKGTARYVFNDQRHKDDLVFVRTGTVDGVSGWAYQVQRGGKGQNLWFFFGSQPVATWDGKKLYPMYYSEQPDDKSGKKGWARIRTPTGTEGVPAAGDEKLPRDKLPKAVNDALLKRFPEAELTSAEKGKTEGGKTIYDVTLKHKGNTYEAAVTPEGEITGYEKVIDAKDMPKAVTQALQEKYPKSA